ncbi:MAG: ATP-grasp domain-containing protein [Proteobacteria bacterium]|nr:ATP-grasp domain-containing protein [Pseudomonadota bacterium]
MIDHPDYQDYRELICFERPAAVWLHYFYGFHHCRLLLADRFHFKWCSESNELKSVSNVLSEYLQSCETVASMAVTFQSRDELRNWLCGYLRDAGPHEALFLPYFSKIGSTTVVSTLVLEIETDRSGYLSSCLRGDNFFIRKKQSLEDLTDLIHLENLTLEYFRFQPKADVLRDRLKSPREMIGVFDVRKIVTDTAKKFFQLREDSNADPVGSVAAKYAFRYFERNFDYWKSLVNEGFDNALLVKLFWPIQFSYQPFVVFIDYISRMGLLPAIGWTGDGEDLCRAVSEIRKQAQVLSNLGILFGKNSSERNYCRFTNQMEELLCKYERLETVFLKGIWIDSGNSRQSAKRQVVLALAPKSSSPETLDAILAAGFDPVLLTGGETEDDFTALRQQDVAGTFCLSENLKEIEFNISKRMNLPHPDEQTLRSSRDKLFMRTSVLLPAGSNFSFEGIEDSIENPQAPFEFPFVVKPNLGYASAGVSVVRNTEEFEDSVRSIRKMNRFFLGNTFTSVSPAVLCETLLEGPEFAVDSITVGGKTRVFGIFSRGFVAKDDFQDHILVLDPLLDAALRKKIEECVSTHLDQIGYTDGPSHTEIRLHKDNGIAVVLECALRVGAGGCMGAIIEKTSGFSYNACAVRSQLRMISAFEWESLPEILPHRYGLFFVPQGGRGGVIQSLRGEKFLDGHSSVFYFLFHKKAGERLIPYPKGPDYPAVVLAVADDSFQLNEIIENLKSGVGVEYV